MNSTRKIKIGAKNVIITNVPDYITDEELIQFALQKILQMQISKESGAPVGRAS